jgi:ABC-type spermidine/putrescine transport system permease subunit II
VLTAANQEGFSIKARNGAMRFFDADTVSEVKIRSKNALNNNMLLGTTAGLAAGGMLYHNQESRGNVTTMVLPVVIVSSIVSGAGVGGFFNSFFAKEKFENVSSSYPEIQRKLAAYAVSTDIALEDSSVKSLPAVNAKF